MGASGSRGKRFGEADKFGKIYIHTALPAYRPGDTVTGKIYINLQSPYPGNELFLRIKGKEAVYMAVEHQDQKGRSIDERHSRVNDILDQSIPIHHLSQLTVGQYVLPFAFMLPAKIPYTFRQEGYRYVADIRYEIGAFIKPLDVRDPKIKYKQELIVWNRSKIQPEPILKDVKTPLTTCCCLSQGLCDLKVKLEYPSSRPGGILDVDVDFDNESKLNNKKITINLKQKLTLKYSKNHSRFFPPECKNLIRATNEIIGIAAGSKLGEQKIRLNLPPIMNIKEKLPSKGPKIPYLLGLKENLTVMNPSSEGSLISSEYFVVAYCSMEGSCVTTPLVSIPVEVNFPELFNMPVPEPPANWKPKTLDAINLVLGVDSNAMPDGSYNMPLDLANSQMIGEQARFLTPKVSKRSIIPTDPERPSFSYPSRSFSPHSFDQPVKQA